MNKMHAKKYFAPIVVTIVFGIVLVAVGFALVYDAISNERWVSLLLAAIPLSMLILLFVVAKSRIDEIKGGQEDDLGKY